MKKPTALMTVLATGILLAGCQDDSPTVNTAPLPAVAQPPYICGVIPQNAVQLMTGLHDPLVKGSIELTDDEGLHHGDCAAYQRTGEQGQVLHVSVDAGGTLGQIETQLSDGVSRPLPEIIPGGFGYYVKDADQETRAGAMLVKGKARLSIELVKGVQGRDSAADVLALMKLIAPKLITTPDADRNG